MYDKISQKLDQIDQLNNSEVDKELKRIQSNRENINKTTALILAVFVFSANEQIKKEVDQIIFDQLQLNQQQQENFQALRAEIKAAKTDEAKAKAEQELEFMVEAQVKKVDQSDLTQISTNVFYDPKTQTHYVNANVTTSELAALLKMRKFSPDQAPLEVANLDKTVELSNDQIAKLTEAFAREPTHLKCQSSIPTALALNNWSEHYNNILKENYDADNQPTEAARQSANLRAFNSLSQDDRVLLRQQMGNDNYNQLLSANDVTDTAQIELTKTLMHQDRNLYRIVPTPGQMKKQNSDDLKDSLSADYASKTLIGLYNAGNAQQAQDFINNIGAYSEDVFGSSASEWLEQVSHKTEQQLTGDANNLFTETGKKQFAEKVETLHKMEMHQEEGMIAESANEKQQQEQDNNETPGSTMSSISL